MRLACRWLWGGLLIAGGCFDPGQPIDGTEASEDSSGGTTTGGPTSGMPTGPTTDDPSATDTVDPPTTTEPDPDSSTTSPPVDCEGDGPDPTCPAEAPFCSDGTCVDCSAAAEGACTGLDPSTPVCDAGTCTACTAHEQCATGACRFATGECFGESNRLWVDNTFGGCAGGVGTEESPVCQVVDAMDILNGQAGMEPWAIFVAGSPNDYEGTVDPGQNRPVAIIGPSAGLAATLYNENTFTVDLWAQSPETYLHQLTLDRGFGGPTIRCNTGQVYVTDTNLRGGETTAVVSGCSLRLDRVRVNTNGMGMVVTGGELLTDAASFDNSSGGLRIEGGTVELHRTVVSNNYVEGGIHVQGAGDLTLVNSMVFNNQYQNDGLFVTAGGTAEVVHSTIIGAADCGAMADVTLRNSIVLGRNFEAGMACGTADVHNSVINAGLGQGMGNVMADGDDLGAIFVNPVLGGMADWHVLPGSIPEGVAVHQAGDPVVDFDLDPRPIMAGAADWAGADVP